MFSKNIQAWKTLKSEYQKSPDEMKEQFHVLLVPYLQAPGDEPPEPIKESKKRKWDPDE